MRKPIHLFFYLVYLLTSFEVDVFFNDILQYYIVNINEKFSSLNFIIYF